MTGRESTLVCFRLHIRMRYCNKERGPWPGRSVAAFAVRAMSEAMLSDSRRSSVVVTPIRYMWHCSDNVTATNTHKEKPSPSNVNTCAARHIFVFRWAWPLLGRGGGSLKSLNDNRTINVLEPPGVVLSESLSVISEAIRARSR
jgi:hypothetical protein